MIQLVRIAATRAECDAHYARRAAALAARLASAAGRKREE
jgi:hypothetical protein